MPGVRAGLTEAVEDFYNSALAPSLHEGEICYGEDLCRDGQGPLVQLNKQPDLTIEMVCFGDVGRRIQACPLRQTKPESVPPYLAEWVAFIEEHDALQSKGVTLAAYDLSPMQRAALLGKARAEARQQQLRDIKMRRDTKKGNTPPSTLETIYGKSLRPI